MPACSLAPLLPSRSEGVRHAPLTAPLLPSSPPRLAWGAVARRRRCHTWPGPGQRITNRVACHGATPPHGACCAPTCAVTVLAPSLEITQTAGAATGQPRRSPAPSARAWRRSVRGRFQVLPPSPRGGVGRRAAAVSAASPGWVSVFSPVGGGREAGTQAGTWVFGGRRGGCLPGGDGLPRGSMRRSGWGGGVGRR